MKVNPILDRKWIEDNFSTLAPWQQTAYQAFTTMIADDKNTYPCIPGRQGFLANHLRFSFIADPRTENAPHQLATAIQTYGMCSRNTGTYASLVTLFETPQDMQTQYTIEDYRQLFWNLLNQLTPLDPSPWPAEIPSQPTDPKWEFCFGGEPYFAFCATPAHQTRKSRRAENFLIAFQPRWVFTHINQSTHLGKTMKQAIRKRLIQYDGKPAHPDLKWYGEGDNLEWKQYFLSDDDLSPSKCPFQRLKEKQTYLH
ncbi:YqcI/YcgG family protein [Hazenella sp. IB182357]|uniref:YqcI/YcgG family protein n=1 Tax=Polycladospora coralii TaxID=2771432 RepID=A0A926N735_9BACL|nr:YqcI/YcgG family protein [Polycladospora coralii]MBD1371121.1 YqcI/YcgG family protein [Polycladospora coralii]